MDSNRRHVLVMLSVVVQGHIVGFHMIVLIHWRSCFCSLPFFPLQRGSISWVTLVLPSGIPCRGNTAPLSPYCITGIVMT